MNELGAAAIHHTQAMNRLPRYLGAAYWLLTAFACLYPFDEVHGIPGSPLEFLILPWPRYFTWLDTVVNIAGFIPLGFLAIASFSQERSRRAFVWAIAGCALFSFGIEFCQNYLDGRVASNIDFACNTLGGVLGAVLGRVWGHVLKPNGWFYAWRQRRFTPGRIGDFGVILVLSWWLTQAEPVSMLFSNGDLRPIFDLVAPLAFSVRRYVVLEAAVVATGLVAFGLLLRCTLRGASPWLLCLMLLTGIGVKSLCGAYFMVPPDPVLWASPGALRGLLAGIIVLVVLWRLPAATQQALAPLALLLATVLVNVAPANPFEEATQHVVRSGYYPEFRGLVLMLALVWPFCALVWLASVSASQRRLG